MMKLAHRHIVIGSKYFEESFGYIDTEYVPVVELCSKRKVITKVHSPHLGKLSSLTRESAHLKDWNDFIEAALKKRFHEDAWLNLILSGQLEYVG